MRGHGGQIAAPEAAGHWFAMTGVTRNAYKPGWGVWDIDPRKITLKSVVRSLGNKQQEDTEVPSCFLNADKNQKLLMISTISEPMRF